MAMPGVKPVMKSDFRLRLSRKTLSLYSSLSVNEGTMVSGARRVGSSSWGSRNAPGCPGCCRSGNWAAAGDAASTITPKTADARRRFTSQRVSHVFRLRKHLFDVEPLDRLVIVRESGRLLDHVDRAQLLDALDLVGRRVPGDDDDRERRLQALHFQHDVEAVHARHRDVQKHRVRRSRAQAVERLGAGVHDRGAMALTLERLREDLGHLRLIVDDQDLHFLSSPLQYLQVDLPILQTARESPRAYP